MSPSIITHVYVPTQDGNYAIIRTTRHQCAPFATIIASIRIPSIRPSPVGEAFGIHTRLIRVIHALGALVEQFLSYAGATVTQDVPEIINRENRQRESITLVPDGEFERRIDVALLLVSPHVHEPLTLTVVGQAMHEPRVRVEVEHHRLVVGEDGGILLVCESVWMIAVRDELEEIHHVDEPNLEIGEIFTQKGGRRKRFLSRCVTTASHYDVWFLVGVRRSPIPDTNALGAMGDGVFHVEILQVDLLVSNNDVHVIRAPEAVIHCRKQTISIRRQVNADYLW
nr:hypothetical protein CFP56_52792 [Quercus suber]